MDDKEYYEVCMQIAKDMFGNDAEIARAIEYFEGNVEHHRRELSAARRAVKVLKRYGGIINAEVD